MKFKPTFDKEKFAELVSESLQLRREHRSGDGAAAIVSTLVLAAVEVCAQFRLLGPDELKTIFDESADCDSRAEKIRKAVTFGAAILMSESEVINAMAAPRKSN